MRCIGVMLPYKLSYLITVSVFFRICHGNSYSVYPKVDIKFIKCGAYENWQYTKMLVDGAKQKNHSFGEGKSENE